MPNDRDERGKRFDFVLSADERAMLERIAGAQDRSAGAVLRMWIRRHHAEMFDDAPARRR